MESIRQAPALQDSLLEEEEEESPLLEDESEPTLEDDELYGGSTTKLGELLLDRLVPEDELLTGGSTTKLGELLDGFVKEELLGGGSAIALSELEGPGSETDCRLDDETDEALLSSGTRFIPEGTA